METTEAPNSHGNNVIDSYLAPAQVVQHSMTFWLQYSGAHQVKTSPYWQPVTRHTNNHHYYYEHV